MAEVDEKPRLAYETKLGRAFQGDSRKLLASKHIAKGSVDLIVTSPPFALTRKKEYGNEQEEAYLEWLMSFVDPFKRVLKPTGSIVIDLGGAYLPGKPQRSTYHFQAAVELAKHFDLCQEFYWYNPAKLPSPAEWVNVRRMRVKDSVNLVLWLANDANDTKADNRRVLKRYSASMEALLKNGYQYRVRPSGHDITDNFSNDHGGAIPPNLAGFSQPSFDGFEDLGHENDAERALLMSRLNEFADLLSELDEHAVVGDDFLSLFTDPNLLAMSNTSSNDNYQRLCREAGVKAHPARFPVGLPAFFIEFLTEPKDIVLDPFAGSNTTGQAAEALGRRWRSCDLDIQGNGEPGNYVATSAFRFENPEFHPEFERPPKGDYHSEPSQAGAA